MPDHVVLLDLERNVIMANASWVRQMCGPGHPEAAAPADMAGQEDGTVMVRCPDCVSEDGGPTPLDRFLREGGLQSGPVRLLPGGEPCVCSVSPYRAPDGTVIGAVLVLRSDGDGCLTASEGPAVRADMAGRRRV
ncbi:hypothetical protein DSECCO2_636680 [anaerobic digester metagenome]